MKDTNRLVSPEKELVFPEPTVNNRKSIYTTQIFNIMNTTLNTGPLTLAYTGKLAGFFPSLFSIGVLFILSSFTYYVYAYTASIVYRQKKEFSEEARKNMSLKEVWCFLFPSATHLLDILIFINCFFGLIGFLVAIGDLVPERLGKLFAGQNLDPKLVGKVVVLATVTLLQLLLSLPQSLDSLKYISYLGLMANVYLIFLGFRVSAQSSGTVVVSYFKLAPGLLEAISIIHTCFSCHYTSVAVFRFLLVEFGDHDNLEETYMQERAQNTLVSESGLEEDSEPSESKKTFVQKLEEKKVWNEKVKHRAKEFKVVAFSAYAGVFVINVLTMTSGYLAFGEAVQSNVTNNFSNDVWGGVLKFVVAVSVFCSFPMVFRALRESVCNLFVALQVRLGNNQEPVTSACLLFLVFTGSIFLKNLGTISAVRGALVGTTIMYTVPGLMLVKTKDYVKPTLYLTGLFLVVFGVLAALGGFGFTIYDAFV